MNPDDVLIAVAHYLPKERRCFKRGREDEENPPRQPINDFFYEQREDFPDLMNRWIFREGTRMPTSINQAISNLYASKLIAVASNYQWHWHFSPIVDCSYEKMLTGRRPLDEPNITPRQDSQLHKLSQGFNKKVACPVVLLDLVRT